MKIKKEARINCENKSSKEVAEKESEKNMSGKEKMEDEIKYKKICFATKDINLSLSNVDVSSPQGFEKGFPKIVHNIIVKIRG